MRSLRPFAFAFLSAALAGAASTVSTVAHAQNVEGFSVNRFDPSERGSDWFVLDSLDLRGHMRPAFGLVADWGYKPLVLYNSNGDEAAAIVEHQIFLHLGGSLILWDSLRVGLDLPLALYNAGDPGTLDTFVYRAPSGRPLGDLRLSGDYRLFGTYGKPLTLAVGAQIYVPTGDADGYTGDDSFRVAPHLSAAGRIKVFPLPMSYAARFGLMVRPNAGVGFDDATGTEFQFAVSAGVHLLDGHLLVGPEVYGSSVVSESGAFFSRRATPLEFLASAHYSIPERGFIPGGFRVGAGIGPGITHGAGTPALRAVASIEWLPPIRVKAVPTDRDGDGVLNTVDACPDLPGVPSEDPARHGCPPPAPGDADGDTITDDRDACPNEPGPAHQDPAKNGCPPPADRDKDTFVDPQDACPDEPGVASEDPKKNGCPPPKDTDQDTFIDPEDACPEQAGVASEDPKKHGCPQAVIEKGQIRILEQVKFATAKATILPESEGILNAVAKIMIDNPSIVKIRVEGHTDNKGSKVLNKTLSAARAASVVKWLTAHGIDKKRLVSQGFGQDKPIATNDTEEGRQENRRVEFHIAEEKKAP